MYAVVEIQTEQANGQVVGVNVFRADTASEAVGVRERLIAQSSMFFGPTISRQVDGRPIFEMAGMATVLTYTIELI